LQGTHIGNELKTALTEQRVHLGMCATFML
jgi:hypothetical protein